MLTGLVGRLAAGTLVVCVLFITAIRAQHPTPPDWYAITTPTDCQMPCFLGVELGVTSASESYRILDAHPWTGRVNAYFEFHVLSWTWSGAQPDWIDADRAGTLQLFRNRADVLGVSTTVPLGEVTHYLADSLVPLDYAPLLTSHEYSFRAEPPAANPAAFIVSAYLPCTLSHRAFWLQRVRFVFSADVGDGVAHPTIAQVGDRTGCQL